MQQALSWTPIVPFFQPTPGNISLPAQWDQRLLATYQDLQHLSRSINEHYSTRTRIQLDCFQNVLSSIQSRLISLHACIYDAHAELIRLGLLTYLTTTFKVPGRKIPYTWIGVQIKNAYNNTEGGLVPGDEVLRLWILIVVAIAIADIDEAWLVQAWKKRSIGKENQWAEVKDSLMKVMWVDCIHDKHGVVALERLMAGAIELDDGIERV